MTMQRYIGSKVVFAEPFSTHDPIKGRVEGYTVKYEDGYISWSPKAVFEAAYRPAVGLSLSMAIEAMQAGYSVMRLSQPEHTFVIRPVGGKPRILLKDDPLQLTLIFDIEDMLANDWVTL